MAEVCGSDSFSYGVSRPMRITRNHLSSDKVSKSNLPSTVTSIDRQTRIPTSQSSVTSQTTVHPPSLSELQCLVSQIKPVLDHIRPKIEINVGVELFKQLQAEVEMGGSEDLSGWGGSRIDYDGKVLIVECGPSIGHEIISDIFHQLSANGASYPRHTGHGTTISQGGSAAVDLTKGMKEPDFSLYETRPLNSDLDNTANSKPTIAWEVAYSESEKKLTTDAARLICLSRCGVLLVVALNIDISGTRESRQLNSVTWSHWEMDALGSEEIAPGKEVRTGKLGILEPDCGDGANIPVAYRAIVAKKDGQISVRAAVTEKYVIMPDDGRKDIPILRRHLFRNRPVDEQDLCAFTIPYDTIINVIESHENIRKSQVFLDANPDVEDRAFEQDLDNMIRSAKVKWESKQRREGPEGNEEDRVGKRLRR